MSEFLASTLKDMGAAGAAISVLLTAVSALVAANVFQYKHGNKVYGYRLAERDTLNAALASSTTSRDKHTKATEDLKDAIEDLADAYKAQAAAFDRLTDRQEMQHETLVNEIQRHGMVISSVAEAMRTLNGSVTEVRNGMTQTLQILQQPRRLR